MPTKIGAARSQIIFRRGGGVRLGGAGRGMGTRLQQRLAGCCARWC